MEKRKWKLHIYIKRKNQKIWRQEAAVVFAGGFFGNQGLRWYDINVPVGSVGERN